MNMELIELAEYMQKEKKLVEDYSKEEIFKMGQKAVIRKIQREEYRKAWYQENKARLHQKYLELYAKNKEEIKAKSREYYYEHPEERKEYHRQYMQRKNKKMTDEEIVNEVSMRG